MRKISYMAVGGKMESLKITSWLARHCEVDMQAYKGLVEYIYKNKPDGYTFKFMRKNWTRGRYPVISSVTAFYEKVN